MITMTGEDGPAEACVLKISHVRSLAAVLQVIKSGNKQVCSMSIDAEGLSLHWEDDSKALQSSLFLKKELFAEYHCGGASASYKFGVQFNLLLDAMHVFSSMPCSLDLLYPDTNGQLVCEMTDDTDQHAVVTYARISTVEQPESRDLANYWEDPASYFMVTGSVMKEAIEDMEWPGADVEVVLQRDPPRLMLEARGTGDLEIELQTSELVSFHVAGPEVRRRYKYKSLRAAFCHVPHPKDCPRISTKASIDSNGLLSVRHIIHLHSGSGGHGGNDAGSQCGHDTSRVANVQFMLIPCEELVAGP